MNALPLPSIDGLEHEESKQILRRTIRAHRKERSEAAQAEASEKLLPYAMDFVKGAKRAACYVSVNTEPSTEELCAAIADSGVELLLPKLGPGLTRSWGFYRGQEDLEQMAPGRPPEPSGPAFDNDILATVDAMIIPALAVSMHGERLGQGGGWYDRALKEIGSHTRVAAMVYSEEFLDMHLPQDSHDVPVAFVLTPDGLVAIQA